MTNRQAKPGEINGSVFDRFTLVHFGVGLGLGGLTEMPLWGIGIAAVGWEVIETPLKDAAPQMFPNPTHDTIANSIADSSAMMVGGILGRALRQTVKTGAYLRDRLRGVGDEPPSSPPPIQIGEAPRYDARPDQRLIYSFALAMYPQGEFRPHSAYELTDWIFAQPPGTPILWIDSGGFTAQHFPEAITFVRASAEQEGYPFQHEVREPPWTKAALPNRGVTLRDKQALTEQFFSRMAERFGPTPEDWARGVMPRRLP